MATPVEVLLIVSNIRLAESYTSYQSKLSLHIPLTAARTNIPFQGVQACLAVVTEQKALYEVSGCKRYLTNPKVTSKNI